MHDYEWYIDYIEERELRTILKVNKFTIPGFRNIHSVPRTYILREIKSQRKRNQFLVHSIMEAIASVMKERFHSFSTLKEFLVSMETHCELPAYQQIALLFHYFPETLAKHEDLIQQNIKNQVSPFQGIMNVQVSTLKKLMSHVHDTVEKTIRYKVELMAFHCYLQTEEAKSEYSEIVERYENYTHDIDGTEENLLHVLQENKIQASQRFLVFLAFLLQNDNIEKKKYTPFTNTVLIAIKEFHIASLQEEERKWKEQTDEHQAELQRQKRLTSRIEKKSEQFEGSRQRLASQMQKQEVVLHEQKEQLQMWASLVETYKQRINRCPFYIVTTIEDRASFPTDIFPTQLITLDECYELVGRELGSGFIFFINRTLFKDGREWMQFQRQLRVKNVMWSELQGYGAVQHMEQILHYFYTKEEKGVEV